MKFEDKIDEAKESQEEGNHGKAISLFQEARDIAEKEEDKIYAWANALLEEGFNIQKEEPKFATKKFRKSANKFKKIGIEGGWKRAKNAIEDLRDQVSIKNKASIQEELLKVNGLIDEEKERGYLFRYRALKVSKDDEFEDAIHYLNKAMDIFKSDEIKTTQDLLRTKAELRKHEGYLEMRNFSFSSAKAAFEKSSNYFEKLNYESEKKWCLAWKDICTYFLTQNKEKLKGVRDVLPDPESSFESDFKKGLTKYIYSLPLQK